jgi:hypothetical protein
VSSESKGGEGIGVFGVVCWVVPAGKRTGIAKKGRTEMRAREELWEVGGAVFKSGSVRDRVSVLEPKGWGRR